MHAFSTSLIITLLLTSVGTGALASILLGVEYFAGGSRAARGMRYGLAFVLTPTALGLALLIVSVCGARLFAAQLLESLQGAADEHVVDLEDVPVVDREAETDRGRPIALFHFAIHTAAADVERFMQATEDEQRRVIRLADANPASNCHGWVFTGGEFGVRDSDVPSILADNGYAAVDQPRDGDLALYVREGQITHTGLARRPDPEGPILVESKWGPFGLYLHATGKQPFSGDCHFYRSPRAGHLLKFAESDGQAAAE